MSYHDRNMRYLNEHRIIYRCFPWSDKPTETHEWGWYYETRTHQCYTLFGSRAKINTYKSLKWHLYVLWYLNPQLDQEAFGGLVKYICNKRTGFVTFNVSHQLRESMLYDVSLMDLEKPPPNKLRKVIFKDFSGLSPEQKMSIVGTLIGRSKRVDDEAIYQCMLDLNDFGKKITIGRIAKLLNCSSRTIHRNMHEDLKKEKDYLNQQL